MKIVTAKEMARIESLAYAHGALEKDFMEQAGQGVADLVRNLIAHYHLKPKITLLCGSGNNAGDAYVAGSLLLKGGFSVNALSCTPEDKKSPLCLLQSHRFLQTGGSIIFVTSENEISFNDSELLVDGLLGTGFHGEVSGLLEAFIQKANESGLPIIAVDIPSGINGTTGDVASQAIRARDTIFLGLPKIGCFVPKAWEHTGEIHLFDFGLPKCFIEEGEADAFLIDDTLIMDCLPSITRTRHKYQAGYVVGFGGSSGMAGAPIMACLSALRSGAGIVRLFYPKEMCGELSPMPFEIIREGYDLAGLGDLSSILREIERASALFFGPGLGNSSTQQALLAELLPRVNKPCLIDADALFILKRKEIQLPSQCILTPHHGEMKKILDIQEKNLPFETLLDKSRQFAKERQVTLVLKGAPTYIIHHDQKPYICSHGDPGMATAGSGDILTGIITGFLAQTKDPLKAAILGVQFHAMAGELAAEKWTSYCMVATDILEYLPSIFKRYRSG